jgi:hypothetical protein
MSFLMIYMSNFDDDKPIREYVKRDCSFSPKTQPKEYHKWYYTNVYHTKQSEYYRKKREEARKVKQQGIIIE